jgi:hypothetical protein
MKKRFVLLSTLILITFFRSYPQDARLIAGKATNAINFESSEMVTTLKIYDDKGNTRIRQVINATRKSGEKTMTLIKFLSPADVKGTSLLIYDYENKDDDMWIYLPALRKSRRIISSEKGKSFMGSEFSNADMSKPNMDDFTYSIEGSENLNGKDCWKIESTGKTDEIKMDNGYSRKISWIEKTTYLTLKTVYYDLSGNDAKIMTLSDYRKQNNGKYFAFAMQMENLINHRESEIIIDKFQLGSRLGEDDFSVASLGN